MLTLHHHGIVVANLATARAAHLAAGAEPIGETYDDPIQQAHICFLQIPGNPSLIELIAPYSADSTVAHFLHTYGGGLHHACYMVDQFQAAVDRFRGAGAIPVFGPEPAVAFRGRSISFMYLRDRSLLELVQASPGESPADLLTRPLDYKESALAGA